MLQQLSVILCKAYNLCSRFWKTSVYFLASPEDTKNRAQRKQRQKCRPVYGQCHFRLADGPTRNRVS